MENKVIIECYIELYKRYLVLVVEEKQKETIKELVLKLFDEWYAEEEPEKDFEPYILDKLDEYGIEYSLPYLDPRNEVDIVKVSRILYNMSIDEDLASQIEHKEKELETIEEGIRALIDLDCISTLRVLERIAVKYGYERG